MFTLPIIIIHIILSSNIINYLDILNRIWNTGNRRTQRTQIIGRSSSEFFSLKKFLPISNILIIIKNQLIIN